MIPSQQPLAPQASAPSHRGPSFDLTSADLSSHMGMVAGSGGLYVQFYYARVRVTPTDAPARDEVRLHVAKAVRGDARTVACHEIAPEMAARLFPTEWARFTASEALPETGTALHELPGLTASQVAFLLAHNFRSIEDVAGFEPDRMALLGFEAVHVQKLARAWLARKEEAAPVIDAAAQAAATEAELRRLREENAAREREMIELRAQVRALSSLQGVAAPPAATGAAVPVDREPFVPSGPVEDAFGAEALSLGMVTGNHDVVALAEDDAAPMPDPIAPRRRGR